SSNRLTSSPSSRMSPAAGRSRPMRCLMSTLLPTPEAPMMKKISPSAMSNDTSWSTAFGPNDWETWRNEIMRGSGEGDEGGARDEEVQDDDGERRVHDGSRRRPPDA